MCQCVAYCTSQHQEQDAENHSKSCHLLQLCLLDHRKELLQGRSIIECYVPRPVLENSYKNLSRLPNEGIEHLFRSDVTNFWAKSFNTSGNFDAEVRSLTFRFTCPLTVLYASERAGLAHGSIYDASSLTIHIVGARQAEVRDITNWEIIPLRLPKLERLHIVFIGQELRSPFNGITDFECKSDALQKLRPNLRVRYQLVTKTYHSFMLAMTSCASPCKPDIVAALNCGFIFYSEWDATLPDLVRYANVPLVFTEYYEEDCNLDLQKLDSLVDDELDVVIPPSTENPFSSTLPARIPTGFGFRRFGRRNVVMSNDFICVVRSVSA